MAFANQTEQPNIPKELKHIQDCYIESFNFLLAWKRRKVRQLVLMNNLQRGDENIASTLLLTLFNRVLSSLYDDRLQIKFLPAQGITQNQINSYNLLAQSDYIEMDKAKLDYDWIWDTLFFNRGYLETLRFNKRRKIIEPSVINPLVFGYDPYFEEVQDWRYYWKWITKSRVELNRLIKNGTISKQEDFGIDSPDEIMSGMDEYLWNYKALRDKAKKAIESPIESLGGTIYQILEFYGYDEDGNKCCYWIDRGFSKVIYREKLDLQDLDYGDGDKGSKWPIVVKEAFREPHSSINFGIADLLEDKHRAKSVLLNLAFLAAKDRANPIYQYNPSKVKDVSQLLSRQINQHIPVEDVTSAIAPLNTQEPMSAGLLEFMNVMEAEANNPMGSGMPMGNIQKSGRNTATQMALEQQLNDMALSLQAKIIQFGEQEFWSHWLHRYAKNNESLGKKMANIVGVKGVESTEIDLKDFNTDYPPGVMVYSAKEAEYKNLVKRRDFMQLYPEFSQTLDQSGMRNFNKFVFLPLMVEDPSLIDVMLPKTIDELNAESENERLQKDELMNPSPTDDHQSHIYIHQMVHPKTWAVWFHLEMHQQLLSQQKALQQQQMVMQAQSQQMQDQAVKSKLLQNGGKSPQILDNGNGQNGKIKVGTQKQNPQNAAVPLQQATTEQNPMNVQNQSNL